ncbi:MAG: heavy metal translocating P-type ATPase [Verrucomicrobia bacterium]|nr:heavy metal translocating P-type ATPase [Verrucomicrobiota bacterium]
MKDAEKPQEAQCLHSSPPPPIEVPEGVLRASVDAEKQSLTLDYDPARITDETIREVASRLLPDGGEHFEKCLMRLHGRACEACAIRFERKAEAIPGVRRATATFIGGVMTVTYNEALLSPEEVFAKVGATGADVSPITAKESETGLRMDRVEAAFTALCLIFTVAGWWAGKGTTLSNAFYLLAYFTGGSFGVLASFQSLRQWTIDVDLLMVLAALGAAYVGAPLEGATLLFLFSLSNVLQEYAIDRTRKAINSLMKLRPEKALTRRDGATVLLPVEQLVVGDIVLVRPGEAIPLDSQIVEGSSAIDQASVTGESMPVHKKTGDPVFAGTINQSGGLEIRVTKLAKDSTIEKLIRMVEEAQSEKAETQRFLDKAEQWYACGVILFTLALIFAPPLLAQVLPRLVPHRPFHEIFLEAMTVMVVASPCALIISTPASILSAIGGAARRGVLFKGGAHLERTATVTVVALDKTGTLTEGKPRITDTVVGGTVVHLNGGAENGALELLQLAAAVEFKSEHPLARAIVEETGRRGIALPHCVEFQSVSGNGATGLVNGRRIVVGSPRYFENLRMTQCEKTLQEVEKLQNEGKTCVLVGELQGETGVILGAIAIADVLRKSASEVVARLKAIGVQRVVMLTGDNHRVAAAIGKLAGVDEVYADLLPEDKVRVIKELKKIGPVAMVGDGVNDAPALALANVGIAMGAAGTDVAMETADVVLMSNDLHNVAFAISIARHARRVIWQNLIFALSVILVLIISALGFHLPLPFGVVGHEGSTVLVCLNGLRLLAFRGKV